MRARDFPACAGGIAVGLTSFNAFGRDQVALGNGVAVRACHVGHKARHRRHDHHRNARSANFRSSTAHFLGKAGDDYRHVVALVRREGGTHEIPHGHASMRTRADEGRANMRRDVARRRIVDEHTHRHWGVARAFDVGRRLDDRLKVDGKFHSRPSFFLSIFEPRQTEPISPSAMKLMIMPVEP